MSISPELTKYVTMAAQAGMTRDQVERFVSLGYVALPWALAFHAAAREADSGNGPTEIAAGGARGPGKSHSIFAQVALDDCQRAPGLKVLFLRKVLKSAAESFDDLTRKVLMHQAHNPTDGRVEFPNGSRILIGGYNTERDIDKYLGIEYDVIVLEEGTQITGDKKDKIRGSLRTSRSDWRARWYESTNPGGIGHADFKAKYVTPYRQGRQGRTRFFPATYRDNPFLKPEYIEYLEGLQGTLGQAWRDGDWDIFEGMAFPAWNPEKHVIKPFPIPQHWPKWRATDWGSHAPFCTLWLTKDPDTGRIFVYREVYQRGLTDRQQARLIRENTPPTEAINVHYADPSMWASKNMDGLWGDTATEYAKEGVILSKANNDRILGKRMVDRYLADSADGRPGLQIFETCPDLVKQMGDLVSAKNNPEDVDTDLEDHAFDTLKYGFTNIMAQTAADPLKAYRRKEPPIGNLVRKWR